MRNTFKATAGYMTVTALLGIALGLLMIFYPGGTAALMNAAFRVFQFLLSAFILYYAFTESAVYFRVGYTGTGSIFFLLGVLGALLVWLFSVGIIYLIVGLFLILAGLAEIIGSFQVEGGSYFLTLLGLINIIVGILILSNPVMLPFLIAWFVLFWGISRLVFSLELRRLIRE